ncbi:MAG: hypothetical protein ACRELG_06760 [Gemmataceae bacterium]
MPPPGATLYGSDTIAEFERAAQQRFDEGVSLASAGFHGGAIYLHGYVAEMLLKAAAYKLLGLGSSDPVEEKRPIVEEWIAEYVLAAKKKPRPHDLDAWARWLSYFRTDILGTPYPLSFDLDLGSHKDVIERIWMPSMRYHQLSPSVMEAAEVQAAALWFLTQYPNL